MFFEKFDLSEIAPAANGLWRATVSFKITEEVAGKQVGQVCRTTVRFAATDEETVAMLKQRAFAEAIRVMAASSAEMSATTVDALIAESLRDPPEIDFSATFQEGEA